jgi:hypothetical protein
MLKMEYDPKENLYSSTFFVRFTQASGSLAAIKLFNSEKSPLKFYKITIEPNKISMYENFRNTNFLLGLNERKLRNTMLFDFQTHQNEMGYAGFWVTYNAIRAELSLGRVGDSQPMIHWIDPEYNSLDETTYMGFEAEKGHEIAFAADC